VRVVGLDLGERRIGVAVSDRAGAMAVAHGVVERTGDWQTVAALIHELEAECVVVGLPLSLDGRRGPAALKAESDAAALRALLHIPVELVDERLTTVTANRSLQEAGLRSPARRRVVDQVAATVLLQSWLDRRRATSAGMGAHVTEPKPNEPMTQQRPSAGLPPEAATR
jgi:putative Holliday junction resolvase